jgi:acid phosphatase family membrane protein YuiD
VDGIAVFSASRVLIDATGVRQLGGLAAALARHTAGKAQHQQHTVLLDAQQLDIASLYAAPPLHTQPPTAQDAP